MAKYNYEFKKKMVEEYLKGQISQAELCKKYGLPAKKSLQDWISSYKTNGSENLRRSRKNQNYSFNFKINIVELYLTSEVSYQELAIAKNINNPSLISQWVNAYRDVGPDALRPRKKGRKKIMVTPDNTNTINNENNSNIDTSIEHVKNLEDELLKLRIENAFLKELRRLRLEEEALQKEQQKSFTVSEDHSN